MHAWLLVQNCWDESGVVGVGLLEFYQMSVSIAETVHVKLVQLISGHKLQAEEILGTMQSCLAQKDGHRLC